MQELRFSDNWNNKLDCNAFTTLRLSDRFNIGDKVNILLKNKPMGQGEIIGKKCFDIKDINDFIGYIDTGYDGAETKKILQRMYPLHLEIQEEQILFG